jgi:hypothetical protein
MDRFQDGNARLHSNLCQVTGVSANAVDRQAGSRQQAGRQGVGTEHARASCQARYMKSGVEGGCAWMISVARWLKVKALYVPFLP